MNPNLIIGCVNHHRYHPHAIQMLDCVDCAENKTGGKLPGKLPYWRLRESQIEDVVPEVRHKLRYPLQPHRSNHPSDQLQKSRSDKGLRHHHRPLQKHLYLVGTLIAMLISRSPSQLSA
jgi:hypothetical protein